MSNSVLHARRFSDVVDSSGNHLLDAGYGELGNFFIGGQSRKRTTPPVVAGLACTVDTGWEGYRGTLSYDNDYAIAADAESGVLLRRSLKMTSNQTQEYFTLLDKEWSPGNMSDKLVGLRFRVLSGASALSTAKIVFANESKSNQWYAFPWELPKYYGGYYDSSLYLNDWYECWWNAEQCTGVLSGSIDWANLAKISVSFTKQTGMGSSEVVVVVDFIGFYEKPEKGMVCIVFDDGYPHEVEAATYALSLNVPTTIAAISCKPGTNATWATWEQLSQLSRRGVCVANHSHTHNYDLWTDANAIRQDYARCAYELSLRGMGDGARIGVLAGGQAAVPADAYTSGFFGAFDLVRTSDVSTGLASVIGQKYLFSNYSAEFTSDAHVTNFQTMIDRAVNYKSVEIFYTHLNYDRTDAIMARFKSAIDYLAAKVANGDCLALTLAQYVDI